MKYSTLGQDYMSCYLGITPLGISKLVIDVNISNVILSDFIIAYYWSVSPQSEV